MGERRVSAHYVLTAVGCFHFDEISNAEFISTRRYPYSTTWIERRKGAKPWRIRNTIHLMTSTAALTRRSTPNHCPACLHPLCAINVSYTFFRSSEISPAVASSQ